MTIGSPALRAWATLPRSKAMDYAKVGLSPEEAQALESAHLRPDVLALELDARHAVLPLAERHNSHWSARTASAWAVAARVISSSGTAWRTGTCTVTSAA